MDRENSEQEIRTKQNTKSSSEPERLIFHIDVNSAFLSWEAARRVAEGKEDLRLIPSLISGDPDRRTSIVLAKSIPAKKFGIKTGEPLGMALQKCPDIVVAKPDFRLYDRNSRAFKNICREYAPAVESASIDEVFCDFTGTGRIYPDPVKLAHEIRTRIKTELGFTVNVGISRNKLLAKMASDFEKPDKVHTLFPEEIREKMWPLPVGDLLTVGESTANILKKARIDTIGQLAQSEKGYICHLLGLKAGQEVWNYANGIDDSPVNPVPEEAKGYSVETTLEENLTTKEEALPILLSLADCAAARMRAGRKKAYGISVSVRTSDFKNHSHQKKLEEATDSTREIYEVVKNLFAELWDERTPIRLLGVALGNLSDGEYEQAVLFPNYQREKEQKADRMVDALRGKFGKDILVRGSILNSDCDVGKKFRARAENQREERNEKI